MQITFNPIDYSFAWTDDWYVFDEEVGSSKAIEACNFAYAKLKSLGKNPKRFTMQNQLMKRGGVGTGNPQIEIFVTIYGINADD
mgnify:CR=1 FL=1